MVDETSPNFGRNISNTETFEGDVESPVRHLLVPVSTHTEFTGYAKKIQKGIWVCLKIVYPFLPNGFADHYPYISLLNGYFIGNINPTFSVTNPYHVYHG